MQNEETDIGAEQRAARLAELGQTVLAALGAPPVRCIFEDGRGAHFLVSDLSGSHRRAVVMPAGSGFPAIGPDRIMVQAGMDCLVRSLSHMAMEGYDLWVTELPQGMDLCSLLRYPEFDDDSKMLLALRLCRAIEKVGEQKWVHGALNPAAIFADSEGAVSLDGVGTRDLMASYWDGRLGEHSRRSSDYIPHSLVGDSGNTYDPARDVHSAAIIIFEMFSGSLPRGSFFRMPSERTVFEPRLDNILLEALGYGTKRDEPLTIGDLHRELRSVGYGAPSRYWIGRDGGDGSSSGRKRRSRVTDGLLGWMPSWVLGAILCVALICAGAIGFVSHERALAEKRALAQLDPALRMLDEAEQLFAHGKHMEALRQIAMVAEHAPISQEVISRMGAILMRENEYDAFMEHGDLYRRRAMREGGADLAAILDVYRAYEAKIADFERAMAVVRMFEQWGDHYSRNAALRSALEIMPSDRVAMAQLEGNPLEVHRRAIETIERLRQENELGEQLRWRLDTRVDGVALDLSENPGLTNIAALRGMELKELELSHTRVQNLWSLESTELQKLSIDGSPVRSLEPLVAAPLRELSFAGAQIRSVSFLHTHPKLSHYYGHIAERRVAEIVEPAPGVEWQNGLGLRFVPLPGGTAWIGQHEVRIADFRAFVKDSEYRVAKSTLPPAPRDWPRDEAEHLRERFPVTGVTRADALAFCEWLGKRDRRYGYISTSQRYRLPRDAEWALAAGIAENPFQDVASRARRRVPRKNSQLEPFRLSASGGLREPEGFYPLDSVSEADLAVLSQPGPVGRTVCSRRVRDMATGVREWLQDDWSTTDQSAVARGASWKHWSEADPGVAAGDPLLRREPLDPDSRATDLGFRLLLEDSNLSPIAPLDEMVRAGEWAAAERVARQLLAGGASVEVRQAAASVIGLVSGTSELEVRGADAFLAVALPMRLADAASLSKALGGELAAPRDAAEERWLRGRFLRPSEGIPIWFGFSPEGDGMLADPWPSAVIEVDANEQHRFVIRWTNRPGDAGAISVTPREP